MSSTPATTAITERLAELELLEQPEIQEALATLKTALERLHEDFAPLVAEARALPEQAQLITVADADSFSFANDWIRARVRPVVDQGKAVIAPYKRAGHVFHTAMTALEKLVTAPGQQATDVIDKRCLAYEDEQARIRKAAEEKAARERARIEHEAAVRLAVDRLIAAAVYVAEQTERAAELARIAESAKEAGDTAAAEAVQEELKAPPPPAIEPELELPPMAPPAAIPEKPKAEGSSTRKNWKHLVENKMQVIRFVADHPEHENLLDVATGPADKLAKAYEERLEKVIPGLKAWNDRGISRKRR